MPARAVRAPERFRGGLPLRRPVTMSLRLGRSHGTGTLPHGVISEVTLTPVSPLGVAASVSKLPTQATGMSMARFRLGPGHAEKSEGWLS